MIDRAQACAAMETARAAAGPLEAKVFAYTDLIEATVKAAKQPGFDAATGWAALETLIDAPTFQRIGNFREVMDWNAYVAMLTRWSGTTEFWSNFRRITTAGNRVFLELEEHNTPAGGAETICHSLSAYEFNEGGKIFHLDIYLQYLPPGMEAAWG